MGHFCCCKKRAFKVIQEQLGTLRTGCSFIPPQTHRGSCWPTLNCKTEIQCVPTMNESLFLRNFVIQVPKPRKPPPQPIFNSHLPSTGLKLISV